METVRIRWLAGLVGLVEREVNEMRKPTRIGLASSVFLVTISVGVHGMQQAPSQEVVPVVVDLFAQTELRSSNWKLAFSAPYGDAVGSVGLSGGGDRGGSALYGPEGLAPVDPKTWWVLDTANGRVALMDNGEVIKQYVNQPPMQLPVVAVDGSLIATTGWSVRQYSSGAPVELVTLGSQVATESATDSSGVSPTIDGGSQFLFPTTRSGVPLIQELNLPVDAPGFVVKEWVVRGADQQIGPRQPRSVEIVLDGRGGLQVVGGVSLQVAAPKGATHFASIAEMVEDAYDGIHILWYGFWYLEDGTPAPEVASYIHIVDGKIVANEPVGQIRSIHDPGAPSRLHVLPGTDTPALSIIGADGVEGWVRQGL